MAEYCPDCQSEQFAVLNEQTDIEISSASFSWTCRCNQCGCKFVIYRTYNLDPYYSYTERMEDND